MDNSKFEKRFTGRLGKVECKKISEFAYLHNKSQAEVIRMCVLFFFKNQDENKIFDKDLKFKQELIYELRRFGNNLNQIAHKLNIALKTEDISASEKIDINQSIQQINQLSTDIKSIHSLMDKRL